ncbi:MAG: glycosyltransferase family 2 protein [Caldilinea sp.]
MECSIVVPVWNGGDVLAECLQALSACTEGHRCEILCVDNASTDGSAALIRAQFPTVECLTQPVNLGFAGGVNVGLARARGEVLVLLNQDCIVRAGWLDALLETLRARADCGIVGAVIEDADGAIDHAGATITRPLAYGQHLRSVPEQDLAVDYVTGAIFAMRRALWEQLGGFDDDFYPAYYEESDYCHRARRQGVTTYLSVAARGRHLFSSRAWQRDPLRHQADQHQSRYRFVCKQFTDVELLEFLSAERAAAGADPFFHSTLGRALAAVWTRQNLAAILARRVQDGAPPVASTTQRALWVGFAALYQAAMERGEELALPQPGAATAAARFEEWQLQSVEVHRQLQLHRAELAALRDTFSETYGGYPWLRSQGKTPRSLRSLLRHLWAVLSGEEHARWAYFQLLRLEQHEQSLHWLDHRMNLLENQLTLQEYRRRLSDLLLVYAQR